MGSKISLLVYEWPLIKCKIWCINRSIFSKFSQNWFNLRKFRKKRVILLKISPKIEQIGMWMGHFFLKNWYLYGSTFKFRGGRKLNLSTSRGLTMTYFSFLKFQSFRPRGSKELKVWSGQGCSSVTWHSCFPAPIKIHLFSNKEMTHSYTNLSQ